MAPPAPHRSQFLLAPEIPGRFASWARIAIPGAGVLATHPDLPTATARRGDRSVTILGFLLDPNDPRARDQDIAEQIVARMDAPADAHALTAPYAGRFVLFASRGAQTQISHDAAGFRAVCHGRRSDGALVAASEPRLAAELADARLDEAAQAFLESAAFRKLWGRHWWPAPTTPYLGVHRLPPNFALDLQSGAALRHWPSSALDSRPLGDTVKFAADTLRGILRAAAERFPLTLFITAGWDSRLVLAACREVADRISCIAIDYPGGEKRDVEVAIDLLRRLGVEHSVVHASREASADFLRVYQQHASLAHEPAAAIAEAVFPRLQGQRVGMTGHLSEVLKGFYARPRFLNAPLSGETLAWMTSMAGSGYAEAAFARWAADLPSERFLDPIDLLYWEQNAGSQQATWMLEWDLVWRDCLVPLDCRALLEKLLGVPYRHRRIGELHRRLMVELWPEVLQLPLKGRQFPARAKSTPAEDVARNLRFVAKELKHGLSYLRGHPRPGS